MAAAFERSSDMTTTAAAPETGVSERGAELLERLLQDPHLGLELGRVDLDDKTAQVLVKEPNIDAAEAVRRVRRAIKGRREFLLPEIRFITVEN
jgi:hypothetical protein